MNSFAGDLSVFAHLLEEIKPGPRSRKFTRLLISEGSYNRRYLCLVVIDSGSRLLGKVWCKLSR